MTAGTPEARRTQSAAAHEVQPSGTRQRVEAWTDKYRLVGQVYLPHRFTGGAARLSDVLNDPSRHLISLTGVAIYRRGDDQALAEHEFLLLNRASIEILRPLD